MGEDLVKDYSEDLHLNAQDQIRYQEMKTYLETKQLPNAIANQLLHTFQKQLVLARKENEGNNHLTGDEIQSYFDREIGQISKVVWRTMLFSMIGTGFLILAAFFLLQAAVHFISVASYGNSGATLTHASIMPFVIFGVFGYGGLAILTYVHTNRHNVHRPLILKLTGWLSLIVGTGFCIASMSLWDDILIIPLNTISSLLFAIISYLIYRWMGSPLKKIQGNRAVEHNQSNQQEKV